MRGLIYTLCCLVLFCLSGCIYRPDIQQGNVLADVDLHGLHIGMTRDEVRAILGDPLLTNLYDENRMVYVYTFKHGHGTMQETRLVIYLSRNRVSQFWTDHFPAKKVERLPPP